jgi:hypothetical protein
VNKKHFRELCESWFLAVSLFAKDAAMRTLFIGFVVVVVLMIAIVPGFWMHVKQLPKDVGSAIDTRVSDPHVQGAYTTSLNKAEQELRDIYCEVYKANGMAVDVRAKLVAQRSALAREERILKRSQELLEKSKPGSTVVIGGANFSFEQANQEASDRLTNTQILRKQILANEQSLTKIESAYEYGTKAIAEKLEALRREKVEFELAKVEDAVLRMQAEIDSSVGKIYTIVGTRTDDTDLQRARKLFYDRLNDRKAKAEFDQRAVLGKITTVPWDKELGVADDASAKIKAYFAKP